MADTKNKTQDTNEEFKSSFGVNASVPDPVTTGDTHKGRVADQAQTDTEHATSYGSRAEFISKVTEYAATLSQPQLEGLYAQMAKMGGIGGDTHANRNDKAGNKDSEATSYKGMKEDIATVFEGTALSEEAVKKATTIFEAILNTKAIELKAHLEEEYETKFEERVEEHLAKVDEAVEIYLERVAEEFIKENEVEIKTSMRVELAESFLDGLKTLFQEHYIDIPEDKVDVVATLTDHNKKLEEELDALKNELLEKNVEKAEADKTEIKESVLAEVSEGLSDLQKEKLASLAESVTFEQAEDLKETLETIKEGFVAKKPVVSATDQLNEEVVLDEAITDKPARFEDPMIRAIHDTLKNRD